MKKTGLFIFFSLAIAASSFSQQKPAPFKAGDRVVFAGNSITEAGFYESYVWLYYMTHFPNRPIEVINGGVGGDVAEQIYRRLEGDLLPKKPTKLVVSFGMNDSKYFEYNDTKNPVTEAKRKEIVQASYKSYLKIQDTLLAHPEIQKIIMSSSPYDETVKQEGSLFKGKAKTMEEIVAFQKKAAKDQNWAYVDLFHPMTVINEKEQEKDSSYTSTGPDRIHPGSAGHLIMAYIFLKDQGLAGHPVARFTIEASKNKASDTENCSISDIQHQAGKFSFSYLAKSLPFPIDTVARVWGNKQVETEALPVIPFMKEFNNEEMKIDGLKGKSYLLKIDGQPITILSSGQLAAGVNLAALHNTPQYQQALQIMDLNSKRKEIEARFRNYYWVQYDFLYDKGLLFDTTQVATDTINANLSRNGWLKAKYEDYEAVRTNAPGLRRQMRIYVDKIYSINKPVRHEFELIEQ